MARGTVLAVCVSEQRGTSKHDIGAGVLRASWGLEGDAHAGHWHRQVSLLGIESIEKVRAKGLDVSPGSLAENITTRGIDLVSLPIGTCLRLGQALVEVTQIGKDEVEPSSIQKLIGDSAIPREGIFVRVLQSGTVLVGDSIETVASDAKDAQGCSEKA